MNQPIEFVSLPSPSPLLLALSEIEKLREALSASASAIASVSEALASGNREALSDEIANDSENTTDQAILEIFHARQALSRLACAAPGTQIIAQAEALASRAYQDQAKANFDLWDALRFSHRAFGVAYFSERSRLLFEMKARLLANRESVIVLANEIVV